MPTVILWVFRLLSLLFLLISAYEDYKTQEIADIWTASFAICCGICGTLEGYTWSVTICLALALLFLSLPDLPFFGGADGVVYAGFGAIFSLYALPIIVAISGLFAVMWWAIKNNGKKEKEEGIVFLPCITVSLIAVIPLLYLWWFPFCQNAF